MGGWGPCFRRSGGEGAGAAELRGVGARQLRSAGQEQGRVLRGGMRGWGIAADGRGVESCLCVVPGGQIAARCGVPVGIPAPFSLHRASDAEPDKRAYAENPAPSHIDNVHSSRASSRLNFTGSARDPPARKITVLRLRTVRLPGERRVRQGSDVQPGPPHHRASRVQQRYHTPSAFVDGVRLARLSCLPPTCHIFFGWSPNRWRSFSRLNYLFRSDFLGSPSVVRSTGHLPCEANVVPSSRIGSPDTTTHWRRDALRHYRYLAYLVVVRGIFAVAPGTKQHGSTQSYLRSHPRRCRLISAVAHDQSSDRRSSPGSVRQRRRSSPAAFDIYRRQ